MLEGPVGVCSQGALELWSSQFLTLPHIEEGIDTYMYVLDTFLFIATGGDTTCIYRTGRKVGAAVIQNGALYHPCKLPHGAQPTELNTGSLGWSKLTPNVVFFFLSSSTLSGS